MRVGTRGGFRRSVSREVGPSKLRARVGYQDRVTHHRQHDPEQHHDTRALLWLEVVRPQETGEEQERQNNRRGHTDPPPKGQGTHACRQDGAIEETEKVMPKNGFPWERQGVIWSPGRGVDTQHDQRSHGVCNQASTRYDNNGPTQPQ